METFAKDEIVNILKAMQYLMTFNFYGQTAAPEMQNISLTQQSTQIPMGILWSSAIEEDCYYS